MSVLNADATAEPKGPCRDPLQISAACPVEDSGVQDRGKPQSRQPAETLNPTVLDDAPEQDGGLELRRLSFDVFERRLLVYDWCMARTNIDIDDEACDRVMRQFGLRTKREAVNLALRSLDAEPMCLNAAHAAQGAGRSLDLDAECTVKLERLQSTAEMSASEIIGWGIELVEQWHAESCRERLDAVLTSEFVGCLAAAPSDLAQNHRRYLDEAFGAPDDAG